MIFTEVITNKAYLTTPPADVWLIFNQTTEINESFCLIFKHEFSQITKKDIFLSLTTKLWVPRRKYKPPSSCWGTIKAQISTTVVSFWNSCFHLWVCETINKTGQKKMQYFPTCYFLDKQAETGTFQHVFWKFTDEDQQRSTACSRRGQCSSQEFLETRQEEEGLKMVARFCELVGRFKTSVRCFFAQTQKQTVTTEQLIGWIWLWAAI